MTEADRQYYLGLGQLLKVGANTPLWLNQGPLAWVVLTGAVDVFALAMAEGHIAGPRYHLFRAGEGQAILGLAPEQCRDMALVAVGVPGTSLAQMTRAQLLDPGQPAPRRQAAAAMLDTWVNGLAQGWEGAPLPGPPAPLGPGREIVLAPGQVGLGSKQTLWLRLSRGQVRVLDRPELASVTAGPFIPLPPVTWIKALEDSALEAVDAAGLLEADPQGLSLDRFHDQALKVFLSLGSERLARQDREMAALDARAQEAQEEALGRLAAVLQQTSGPRPYAGQGAIGLLAACRAVAGHLGIDPRTPPSGWETGDTVESVMRLARAWRVRVRPVTLDAGWWTRDNGPLLGTAQADGRPLALLPASPGSYQLYDPAVRARRPLDAGAAAELDLVAYMFYRPLPPHALGARELVKFGCRGLSKDLWMVLLMGICGGLLSMVAPVATGLIFDSIIPSAERLQLSQMIVALAVVALTGSMFRVVRNLAMLRVEGKMDAEIQAGVWDRLLALPVPFFRGYTAGDLANRANGISTMRRIMTSTMTSSVMTGIFSLFSFALLFYYDWILALVSSLVVVPGVVAAVVLGMLKLGYQRPMLDTQGRIAGLVLQVISGIDKLHVAGVEERSLLSWSGLFSGQKELGYKSARLQNILSMINSGLPILGTGLLYYWMAFHGHGLSTGDFMAFTAAFGNFLSGMLALTTGFIAMLQIVPIYQRAKPILDTLPEFDQSSSDPGQLSGAIELSHLSFRYSPEGPLILNDVCLFIKPGQFVALAGPSGSGKSTLLRLLLGFEKPSSGAVLYDGQDLEDLDKQAVRRQLGVVLQAGKLTPGDILSNIVGASNLGEDAAWEAAEMAGLADDVRAMPMGMRTVISEGSGTLSGGQAQRLLIARAVVKKPRVIFLDEATSALDNQVQAVVTESMVHLRATRVVIAHRLSTIRHAEHIVVMDHGKVIEQGGYDELMANNGLFAELARRQMA
ncbi:MAG: NHLP bacteriocin export ABC transporter permease/ATPase subunit [Desulfarculus sp.]|nr:NHLP bacteriocin export ABC transporter permease/ATPase subunit [Desulfarculus sp.]